jgi:hypothetical protein
MKNPKYTPKNIYALQAIYRAAGVDVDNAIAAEQEWQYRHLLELRGKS